MNLSGYGRVVLLPLRGEQSPWTIQPTLIPFAISITSSEGQVPLFDSSDATLKLACDRQNIYHLSKDFRLIVQIQLFLSRVNHCMIADTGSRHLNIYSYEPGTLLVSLEDDLQQLEHSLRGSLTGNTC